jgi:hypothetical protein
VAQAAADHATGLPSALRLSAMGGDGAQGRSAFAMILIRRSSEKPIAGNIVETNGARHYHIGPTHLFGHIARGANLLLGLVERRED